MIDKCLNKQNVGFFSREFLLQDKIGYCLVTFSHRIICLKSQNFAEALKVSYNQEFQKC